MIAFREVDCPRCHEPCGWCSDFRHMHGKIKLPGSRTYCRVPGMEPEGDGCPLCHGSRRVIATTTYASVGARPEGGDCLQAPFTSDAVREAQTPSPIQNHPHNAQHIAEAEASTEAAGT